MSTPTRPARAYLVPSDAHTPDEDIILVRSSAKNPIGSCYRGIAIPPGGLGYQTRERVEGFPWSTVLHPYTPPAQVAPQATPPVEPDPLGDLIEALTPEPAPPKAPAPRVLSAKEVVAFIATAAPGEYDQHRADPRRSVRDAIEERDHDHATAGG